MTNETRDRRCPLRVVVSASERSRIEERAQAAGLSVSAYLRTAGLCHPIRSAFDNEAVVELARVNGDQGRLGGLLKLWLAERPSIGAPEIEGSPVARPNRGAAGPTGRNRWANMIAKRIVREKAASDFERLGAYVLNARGGVDPASWSRLGAYVLDEAHQGEKVAWARVTNCQSDDPGWAVKEIVATQARNTRSQADKSYHLVVSFPEGERPTREQLTDIEDKLCAALGFAEHQRVSAVHQNTDNWHMHIAINKVHPGTFRNIEPFRDHFRLQEACADLEIKHGLIRDNHTPERGGPKKPRGRAADFEAFQGYPSFLQWVRETLGPHCSMPETAAKAGKGCTG